MFVCIAGKALISFTCLIIVDYASHYYLTSNAVILNFTMIMKPSNLQDYKRRAVSICNK